jgi:hypothetical protein
MSLIRLTALPHPDLNGGKPWPVYVDRSRVLLITRSWHQHVKIAHGDVKREVYDDLYSGARRLAKMVNDEMPMAIDDERTAKWAKEMHALCHDVNECYQAWGRSFRAEDFYERVECTEVQLACGTALEHGVMLTRVWVTDSPEDVFEKIRRWPDDVGAIGVCQL